MIWNVICVLFAQKLGASVDHDITAPFCCSATLYFSIHHAIFIFKGNEMMSVLVHPPWKVTDLENIHTLITDVGALSTDLLAFNQIGIKVAVAGQMSNEGLPRNGGE